MNNTMINKLTLSKQMHGRNTLISGGTGFDISGLRSKIFKNNIRHLGGLAQDSGPPTTGMLAHNDDQLLYDICNCPYMSARAISIYIHLHDPTSILDIRYLH